MKKLEFETSKGRFVIKEYDTFNDLVKDANFYKQKICKLSEITEEQASEIVGIEINMNHSANHNIMQLHSLLKSKGIYLYKNPNNSDYFINRSTEQKTFYNPYIFKL